MEFKSAQSSNMSASNQVSETSKQITSETYNLSKFIVLTFRKYTDLEWETFEKWGMRVYEYTKTSAAGSSIDILLEKYDVILIDPFKTESLQFWNLAKLNFPENSKRVGIFKDAHVVSLVKKRCSCSEIERYGIQSQVKELYDAADASEFVQSLIAGTLKKPSSAWVEAGKKLLDFVLSLLPLVSKRG